MKISLIYLPHPYLKQPGSQAPLGLLYLASVLERANYDVSIQNFTSLSDEQAIDELEEADLYGITATSLELPSAGDFAKGIKKKYPKSKIIVGGAGTCSEDLVDLRNIDSICKGEAELAIVDIVEDARTGKLQDIYIARTPEKLDEIPFPARHLLDGKLGGNIFSYNQNYVGSGSTVITSSRGCPCRCAYCTAGSTSQRRVRFRNVENLYDEIKEVVEHYGVRQFRFSDDMFTADQKRVLQICERIGDLNIAWRISCRVKPCTKPLFKAMYDAGCKEVSLGVESFDQDVLDVLKKGTTVEDNVRALEICDEVGIKARILLMINTPGQTRKTIEKNIFWLARVPYNIIACTIFVPLPGSDIWRNPASYNITILERDLRKYNFYFFGPQGENEIPNIIELHGRDTDEVNKETRLFRDYLKSTGKLNQG